ncbi:MAG TPA: MmgE/PrpD family protein [Stellaceae bacterium]|nr:MmgE/PrpD family protein [Stellaceae bacterium]
MTASQTALISARIAAFVHQETFASLPPSVVALARDHLLDTIGCCVAAADIDTSQELAALVREEGGADQASAIGIATRLPAAQAAFVNGALARSLEYDDMAMPDLHPSGAIAPVVLAIGEWRHASGAELVAAYALGLELCLRIGRAGYDPVARTSRFLQRGQDSSAICGTVAGAAVAARLLGLDPRGIADAIGIAVSLAGGSLEANRSGGTIKRLQSGWAASSAVRAACMARAGISGPAEAFEGRYGFYRCFLDGAFDPSMLVDDFGLRWEVLSLRIKPYPSNYYTHAGIDAALALVRGGVRPEEIQSAELAVAAPMMHTMGEPLDRKQAPQTAYEAKFSGPYTVAAALLGGGGLGVGIDDFSDALVCDPTRRALMRRITVVADAQCDAVFPDQAPAILTMVTATSERRTERVMVNRGGPDRPLGKRELDAKFSDNVKRALPPPAADALRNAIRALPEGSIANIAATLRAASRN